MADTVLQVVVSPFLGVLFDNLSSLIQSEIGLIWGVKKEMKKLSRTLSTIKDVLHDAEEKQVTDEAIRNWLSDLKDAAYDADDVLDECAFNGLQLVSEMRNYSCTKSVTDSFLSCLNFKQNSFHQKIGRRIKELRERFDEIADERSKFHLKEGFVERRVKFCYDRETSSMLTEPEVYGRHEDKENLVTRLLNHVNGEEDLSICPVLGIGGLGKTTLAQLVYNDQRVAKHFTVRLWVCVSDDFNVKRLIKSIIVTLSGNACDLDELEHLQHRLQEELRGEKFLLVLDDVWNENQDEWNKLKSSLRCGAEGSSIIITTRLETVASIMGTLPAYRLKVLSEDDCWSLFKQRAFGLGNEERPDLREIGREIVKKCGGVPLAAKALGGLMCFKCEENEWMFVRDSEIWDLPQGNENNILPALRLSYNHLPPYSRECFSYCSIFPKDYEIRKDELIHLWMANGLVQSKGRMELEDVGNEVFNALLWRSFFQDIRKDKDGNIETCKMHDLVHDLACHITVDECSVLDVRKAENIVRRNRHLSLVFSTQPSSSILESIPKLSPCLRSLVSLTDWLLSFQNPQFIFSSLTRLRALDLRYATFTMLPDSIGKMKHLRYLNLSHTNITSLPEYICGLTNLLTLKLTKCYRLRTLPQYMKKMSNLRHLEIRGCNRLTEMPTGIGQLTCLQTLSFFIVGYESGCGIKELQWLNLGGELEIKGLHCVQNSMDVKEANLVRKKNLRTLRLSWPYHHFQQNSNEVIEFLQPHSNLRRLFIEGYKGVTFPNWLTVSTLPNLVEISLSMCARCEFLPPLRKLPLLKYLEISSMNSVKFITHEIYGESVVEGFPSLEEVKLVSMQNLEGWSSSQRREGARLPCLKKLILEECPKLTGIPLSSSLEKVEVSQCNEMVLGSLQNLSSLSSIGICEFHESSDFPEGMLGNLTALQKLAVEFCNNLKRLPTELESLSALTWLWISHCRELVSLPEGLGGLSFLKSLTISNCHALKCLPKLEKTPLDYLCIYNCSELEFSTQDFQHLVVLKSLALKGLPKLTCFPEGLKHVTRLQYLSIHNCSDSMDLPDWIGSLTSLQSLYIDGCKNRKVLLDGLQHLIALRTLRIRGCDPDLERRCEKGKGEDWYKVSHVALVDIQRA